MDYPIKTLSQLRPILQGFRKTAGLTQAALAARLGITQQSYAQLEANPASASVERMFKVLRMLEVEIQLRATHLPAGQELIKKESPKSVAGSATTRENW